MQGIGLSLEPEIIKKLDLLVRVNQVNRSEIVNQALKTYFQIYTDLEETYTDIEEM